ncbi:phosphoribosyltransferase [Prosthecomicrobium sp. N25]|uniref:phosphoribosyltransferase n=1 Tax=Prosthecomicrobium sp. N25 TaxID=3129254 RepID=UPI003076CEE1
MTFLNRRDAGLELAAALEHHRADRPLVYALPRGGVPVAAEVARSLGAPLDLLIVRKVGAPADPELAIGAIAEGPEPVVVRNEEMLAGLGLGEADFAAAAEAERAELTRRRWRYLGGRHACDPKGRLVILVDDGIATGATVTAAVRALRLAGARRLVLAVPVAPPDALARLRPEVDEIVCLESHDPFGSVGGFYRDFAQVGDREVIDTLQALGPGVATDPQAGETGPAGP